MGVCHQTSRLLIICTIVVLRASIALLTDGGDIAFVVSMQSACILQSGSLH